MSDANPQENPTFHLGLTMAGAVSAGCYSAGVIDYLFEILDLWERAKKNGTQFDDRLIPKHNVVIEAMGGTSAGGMTTMMTGLYALGNQVNPVKGPLADPYESKNILYDSWVHLDDKRNPKLKTFASLWETTDIPDNSSKLQSVFNSNAIDNIADRAYNYYPSKELKERVDQLPSYISKELEILLSHTVLRGIPLEVDFSTFRSKADKEIPTHTSYEHALITHYKLNNGIKPKTTEYFWFNPYDAQEMPKMKLSTIATGAFPVGLKYRTFAKGHFSYEYMQSILKRSIFADFGNGNPDPDNKLIFKSLTKEYETITVDGGAVNNEPYGEVLSIVRSHAKAKNGNDTNAINHGVVMIDPFPDMVNPNEAYKPEKDLFGAIPSIFGVLRHQSKIKRKEMIDHLSHRFVKGQIYPKRHYYDASGAYVETEPHPIASASFEAFGGFLDIQFRVHDYFLGRDNARNFFRYFFSLPATNPIFSNWTQLQKQFFGFMMDGELFLPIIPDLNLLTVHQLEGNLTPEQKQHIEQNEFNFSGIQKQEYTISERPKYNPEELFALESNIRARFKRIFAIALKRNKNKSGEENEENKLDNARSWINDRYSPFWSAVASFISKPFVVIFVLILRRVAKRKLTKGVITAIINDLDKRKLLKQK